MFYNRYSEEYCTNLANRLTKMFKRYYTTIKVDGKWVVTDRYSPV